MILKILLENLDFSIEKIDFSIEKIEIFVFSPKINILFSIFFEIEIFKIIFLQEKKFFDQIFFPASGDVHTSRLYAQSGLGVTFCRRAPLFIKRYTVTTFSLEDLSYIGRLGSNLAYPISHISEGPRKL